MATYCPCWSLSQKVNSRLFLLCIGMVITDFYFMLNMQTSQSSFPDVNVIAELILHNKYNRNGCVEALLQYYFNISIMLHFRNNDFEILN